MEDADSKVDDVILLWTEPSPRGWRRFYAWLDDEKGPGQHVYSFEGNPLWSGQDLCSRCAFGKDGCTAGSYLRVAL